MLAQHARIIALDQWFLTLLSSRTLELSENFLVPLVWNQTVIDTNTMSFQQI